MLLDNDKNYALVIVYYDERHIQFIASDFEPIVFDHPENVRTINIKRVGGGHDGMFALAPAAMPELSWFNSKVAVRGLDVILDTTREMEHCKSRVWCKKGEWFIMPTIFTGENDLVSKIIIDGHHGCYEFGKDTMIAVNADDVEYIKTAGQIYPDSVIAARVIETPLALIVDGQLDDVNGWWDSHSGDAYRSQEDYFGENNQTIWEYLGVRHYTDSSRAKSARTA